MQPPQRRRRTQLNWKPYRRASVQYGAPALYTVAAVYLACIGQAPAAFAMMLAFAAVLSAVFFLKYDSLRSSLTILQGHLRELERDIQAWQQEREALWRENEALRARLRKAGVDAGPRASGARRARSQSRGFGTGDFFSDLFGAAVGLGMAAFFGSKYGRAFGFDASAFEEAFSGASGAGSGWAGFGGPPPGDKPVRCFYEELGVERTATDDDLKTAYRTRVKQCHPDKFRGDKAKEEEFKRVNAAYEVLKDPHKRAYYDRFGVPPQH